MKLTKEKLSNVKKRYRAKVVNQSLLKLVESLKRQMQLVFMVSSREKIELKDIKCQNITSESRHR